MVSGDQMHRMRRYPLHKASKFLLLSEKDEINFEVASILLDHDLELGPKIGIDKGCAGRRVSTS